MTPSVVRHAIASAANATSVSVTLDITAGASVWVAVGAKLTGISQPPSDSLGNTYTFQGDVALGETGPEVAVYNVDDALGGSGVTVTADAIEATDLVLQATVVNPTDDPSPDTPGLVDATQSVSPISGTYTPTAPTNELLLFWVCAAVTGGATFAAVSPAVLVDQATVSTNTVSLGVLRQSPVSGSNALSVTYAPTSGAVSGGLVGGILGAPLPPAPTNSPILRARIRPGTGTHVVSRHLGAGTS
ncbi:MAG: hypothetical protein ACREB9_07530 [Thermoplasmata archaeon]